MTKTAAPSATQRCVRRVSILAAMTASLMTGACAQLSGDEGASLTALSSSQPEAPDTRSELEKATEYWGKEYAKNPTKAEPALAYAKNLKALGHKRQALSVLQSSVNHNARDIDLISEYGRLAVEFDQLAVAEKLLERADIPGKPDWKVISARGTVLARQGRYKDAIPMFERAMLQSNGHPSVMNNLAMAHAMGGNPKEAENILRDAIAKGGSEKVNKNLALVLGLQGRYAEAKEAGAKVQSASFAASDTETIRKIVNLPAKSAPAPATQVAQAPRAATPALKGATSASDTGGQKWDQLVAQAEANSGNLRGAQ